MTELITITVGIIVIVSMFFLLIAYTSTKGYFGMFTEIDTNEFLISCWYKGRIVSSQKVTRHYTKEELRNTMITVERKGKEEIEQIKELKRLKKKL